jgi:hypothetical protein
MKSKKQGCATTIYCATSTNLKGIGGLYYSDCNVSDPVYYCYNKNALKKLWSVSEQMTNIKFPDLKIIIKDFNDNINNSIDNIVINENIDESNENENLINKN